jgi:hypothetical protein
MRNAGLRLEALETRYAPAAVFATSDYTSPAGQVRTYAAPTTANTTAQADVVLTDVGPVQLFARGQAVDEITSFYAGVSVEPGRAALVEVIDGITIERAEVALLGVPVGTPLHLQLVTVGEQLTAWVQRSDTGEYLAPAGQWQTHSVSALAAPHERATAGSVGVSYPVGTTAPSFVYTVPPTVPPLAPPPAVQPPPVVPTIPPPVVVPPTVPPPPVVVPPTVPPPVSPPPVMVPPTVPPMVPPPAPSGLPSVDRHFSHIRLAQVAYEPLRFTSSETQLAQNAIDLVITVPRYLASLAAADSNTPAFIYGNLSNIYYELLTDWLSYADAHGLDRELAFYHTTAATDYYGDSPSAVPVDYFWSAQQGPTTGTGAWRDVTWVSRGLSNDASSRQTPGPLGHALYLGYLERFTELNVSLHTSASNGWAGKLEYARGRDANGAPTDWQPLSITNDGTNGWRQSGKISFALPSSWQASSLRDSADLFFVRVRTTAAGTAPVTTRLTTADYTNANRGPTGTMPAFDDLADHNADGYLTDSEYAQRRSGFDARFEYQGRVFYPYYGANRYILNLTAPAVRTWAADYYRRVLDGQPLADGLFLDNSGGTATEDLPPVREVTSNYTDNFLAALATVQTAIAPRWIVANSSGGTVDSIQQVVEALPATFAEFALRPVSGDYGLFEDTAEWVANWQAAGRKYLILDSYPGSADPTDPRVQLATLAEYYLLADPDTTFLSNAGGAETGTAWSRHYFAALAYNVGRPTDTWSEFARGNDPDNLQRQYRVYQRHYSNALVLYKPLSAGSTVTNANTATTHTLDRAYRPLNADGTLGTAITQITLSNGEGAVLIPA